MLQTVANYARKSCAAFDLEAAQLDLRCYRLLERTFAAIFRAIIIGKRLRHYTMQQPPRRQPCSYSTPWVDVMIMTIADYFYFLHPFVVAALLRSTGLPKSSSGWYGANDIYVSLPWLLEDERGERVKGSQQTFHHSPSGCRHNGGTKRAIAGRQTYSCEQVNCAADGTRVNHSDSELKASFTLGNKVKLSKVRTRMEVKRNCDQYLIFV